MKYSTLFPLLILCLFLSIPFLKGCAPVVVAGAVGGGYLVADDNATHKIDSFLGGLFGREKVKCNGEIILKLYQAEVQPQKATYGQEVKVCLIYSVSCAPESGQYIREKIDLYYKDKKIKTLNNEKIKRTNGKWKTVLSFTIPKGAAVGEYIIKQEISSPANSVAIKRKFWVIK